MVDTFSPEKRSEVMSRIRSSGNASTELQFIKILRKNKISGWRRKYNLPGKPDFVFPAARVAVFIDGDFWHGNPRNFRLPKSNVEYWSDKILSNRRRDQRISRRLRSYGWSVLRFWESDLRNDQATVRRLERALLRNVS